MNTFRLFFGRCYWIGYIQSSQVSGYWESQRNPEFWRRCRFCYFEWWLDHKIHVDCWKSRVLGIRVKLIGSELRRESLSETESRGYLFVVVLITPQQPFEQQPFSTYSLFLKHIRRSVYGKYCRPNQNIRSHFCSIDVNFVFVWINIALFPFL